MGLQLKYGLRKKCIRSTLLIRDNNCCPEHASYKGVQFYLLGYFVLPDLLRAWGELGTLDA